MVQIRVTVRRPGSHVFNVVLDFGNARSRGAHRTNAGNQRGSAREIISECTHLGGGVPVKHFGAKFETGSPGFLRPRLRNPRKRSRKKAESSRALAACFK